MQKKKMITPAFWKAQGRANLVPQIQKASKEEPRIET
jgi:hypothetical protein